MQLIFIIFAIILALAYGYQLKTSILKKSFALGLTTADFKNGMTFEIDNVPVKLLEYMHVKPGKGSAFVRTKIKNLLNGGVQERTFRAGESVTLADINRSEMQYTFTDGDSVCFMNMESFEEERVSKSKIVNILLLREGLACQVMKWGDDIIDVQLPPTVEYVVVETTPNYKGNSGAGVTKPATLDSGAIVNVPMFIEIGEKIIVSTDDVKYAGRA